MKLFRNNAAPAPGSAAAVFVALAIFMVTLQPVCGRALDRTIAKINNDIITESDLAQANADSIGSHHVDTGQAFVEATSETVEAMLDRRLLLQEAKRLQIAPADEELHRQVESMVREVKANFPEEKDFYQALALEHLSLDQFKDQLLKKTREDFMVYHVIDSQFSVSRSDIEDKAASDGGGQSMLRLRRLGIGITKKVSADQARQRARGMVAQTITDGISFEEGVRRYSEVPGAAQDGGDMGYVELDKLSSDVRAAVQNLQVGQASAPIIAGGYANIFYVEGKRGAKNSVREQKFSQAREELLANLRRKAVLQVYDNQLLPLLSPEYQCRIGSAELSTSRAAQPAPATKWSGPAGATDGYVPAGSPANPSGGHGVVQQQTNPPPQQIRQPQAQTRQPAANQQPDQSRQSHHQQPPQMANQQPAGYAQRGATAPANYSEYPTTPASTPAPTPATRQRRWPSQWFGRQ